MRQLDATQPHFGPAVFIDDAVSSAYAATTVDVAKMGQNLQEDFPEVSQAEWDQSMVYLTDSLVPSIGGFASNMLLMRNSRAQRLLYGAGFALMRLFNGANLPSQRKMEAFSQGRNVLVVLNLAGSPPDFGDASNAFFSQEHPLTRSIVLAHELHHAVVHLLANRTYANQLEEMDRYSRRVALHAGSLAMGLVGIGAGASAASAVALSTYNMEALAVGSGIALGGVGVVASTGYAALKHGTLAVEKFDLELPPHPYGQGEDCANAYARSMYHKWQNVVTV